jgi:hypothetical protein
VNEVRWMDFDLSQSFGPLLVVTDTAEGASNIRVFRKGNGLGGRSTGTIRRMGMGEPSQSIQETGQGKGPARMVGGSSSALTNGCSPIGMDAGPESSVAVMQSPSRKTGREG